VELLGNHNNVNITASRISVDFKGDNEQPFAQNDLNRCVISTLK